MHWGPACGGARRRFCAGVCLNGIRRRGLIPVQTSLAAAGPPHAAPHTTRRVQCVTRDTPPDTQVRSSSSAKRNTLSGPVRAVVPLEVRLGEGESLPETEKLQLLLVGVMVALLLSVGKMAWE